MLKKIILLTAIISSLSQINASSIPHSCASRIPTYGINVSIKDLPYVPIKIEASTIKIEFLDPHTLISMGGLAGCLAAIQLWKKGKELKAFRDSDARKQKDKHDEGDSLVNDSYILFAASTLAILNKTIFNLFTHK